MDIGNNGNDNLSILEYYCRRIRGRVLLRNVLQQSSMKVRIQIQRDHPCRRRVLLRNKVDED